MYPCKYINASVLGEDASEGAIVERRGRFKVTSADVSPKVPFVGSLLYYVHGWCQDGPSICHFPTIVVFFLSLLFVFAFFVCFV